MTDDAPFDRAEMQSIGKSVAIATNCDLRDRRSNGSRVSTAKGVLDRRHAVGTKGIVGNEQRRAAGLLKRAVEYLLDEPAIRYDFDGALQRVATLRVLMLDKLAL